MFKKNKALSSSPPASAAIQPPLAPSVLAAPPAMSTSHKGGARNLTKRVVRGVKRILEKLRPRRRKGKKGELDVFEPMAFAAAVSVSLSAASLSGDSAPTGNALTSSESIFEEPGFMSLAASISVSSQDGFTPSLTVSRQHSPSVFYPGSLPAAPPMLAPRLSLSEDAHVLSFIADSAHCPGAVNCHEEKCLPSQNEFLLPSLDLLCSMGLGNADSYRLEVDVSSGRPNILSSGQSASDVANSALPPALVNFASGSSSRRPISGSNKRFSHPCTSIGLEPPALDVVSSSKLQVYESPSFSHHFCVSEFTGIEQPFTSPSLPFSLDGDRPSANELPPLATTTQEIQSDVEAQSSLPLNTVCIAPCGSVGSFLCMAEAAESPSLPMTATTAIQHNAKAPSLDIGCMAYCAFLGSFLCMAEASMSAPVHATDAAAFQGLCQLPDTVDSFEHLIGPCVSPEVVLSVNALTTDVVSTSMATSVSRQSILPSSRSFILTGLLSLAFSTLDVEALISCSEAQTQAAQDPALPSSASIFLSIPASSTQIVCVQDVGLLSLAFSTIDVEALISSDEALAQVVQSTVPTPSASASISISDSAVLYPLPLSTQETSVSSVCDLPIAASGEVYPHPVVTAIASPTTVSATTCVPVIAQETLRLANSAVAIPEFIPIAPECDSPISSPLLSFSRSVTVSADVPERCSPCTCRCSAPAMLKIYTSVSIQTDLLQPTPNSDILPPPAPPAPPPPPMYKSPPPVKIKLMGRNGRLVCLDIRREGGDGMYLTELSSLLAAQANGGPRVLRKTERAEDKHETGLGGCVALKKTGFQVGASLHGDEDLEKVKIRTKEEWGKTVKRRPITMKEGMKENTPSAKASQLTRTNAAALNDITNTAHAKAPFLSELETAIAKSRGGRPLLTPIPVLEDKGEDESAQSTSPWGPRLRGKTPGNAVASSSPPRRSKKLELELSALSSGRRIPEGGMSLAAMAICERIKAERKKQEEAEATSEGA